MFFLFILLQVFPMIVFDYDFIEILNNRYFKLSSRTLVDCPFNEDEFGVVSPRCFRPFDSRSPFGDAEYFTTSLINSFPNLKDRVRFCNKFYQCLLWGQLQHKTRKLVVVGAKDSGKTSWVRVFMGLMDKEKIAVLSKEEHFGTSMVEDDTELLWIDEWTKDMLPDDTLKTMLQGGYFAQSVKFKSPRMQQMRAGAYLTCNKVPDYGEEQVNIERRLYICDTKELEEKVAEAPEWMEKNAMKCLLWMATFINANVELVEQAERFYELPRDVRGDTILKNKISPDVIDSFKNATLFSPVIAPTPNVNHDRIHEEFSMEKGNLIFIFNCLTLN